jgi:murein endopeptidase
VLASNSNIRSVSARHVSLLTMINTDMPIGTLATNCLAPGSALTMEKRYTSLRQVRRRHHGFFLP